MSRKKRKTVGRPAPPAPPAAPPPEIAPAPAPEAVAAESPVRLMELFWLALRLSIPVVGVLFLGWPQITAALFYIFETWLFLMSRATSEQLVDEKIRWTNILSILATVARSVFGLSLVLFIIGGLSIVLLSRLFLEQEWRDFAAGGWQDPSFLVSVATVLAIQAADVYLFVKASSAGRTPEQKLVHEVEKMSRVLALFLCNFVVAIGEGLGIAGYLQVIAMSALMFLIESRPWRFLSNRAQREQLDKRELEAK
jgi:hypothetical protein